MAVTYKPHKSQKTLLIGGQSLTTGTNGGLVGPFPKFSINREELSTGDGTYIGTKFSIEILLFVKTQISAAVSTAFLAISSADISVLINTFAAAKA